MDLYISADVDTVGKVDFFDGNPEQRFQIRRVSTTIVPAWETGFWILGFPSNQRPFTSQPTIL